MERFQAMEIDKFRSFVNLPCRAIWKKKTYDTGIELPLDKVLDQHQAARSSLGKLIKSSFLIGISGHFLRDILGQARHLIPDCRNWEPLGAIFRQCTPFRALRSPHRRSTLKYLETWPMVRVTSPPLALALPCPPRNSKSPKTKSH